MPLSRSPAPRTPATGDCQPPRTNRQRGRARRIGVAAQDAQRGDQRLLFVEFDGLIRMVLAFRLRHTPHSYAAVHNFEKDENTRV